MLPGTYRLGIADDHRLAGRPGAHDVRQQTVERPIAAADDVSGTRRGHRDRVPGAAIGMEERPAIGGGYQFGAAFAAAVRIVAAHRLVLTIGPVPFLIFVALIAGDDDDGANAGSVPDGFQKVNGAEDVDRVGLHRALIGEADERLRGHVEDNLGLEIARADWSAARSRTSARMDLSLAVEIKQAIETGIGGRIKRVATEIGAHGQQPESQPTTLEAGVSGKENLAGFPEAWVHRRSLFVLSLRPWGKSKVKLPTQAKEA